MIIRGLGQCNLGWDRDLVSLYWFNRCYLFHGQVQKFWKIITLGGKITISRIKFLTSEIYRHTSFIVLRFIAFHSCWVFFLQSEGKTLLLHLIVILGLWWSGKELAIPPSYACNYIPQCGILLHLYSTSLLFLEITWNLLDPNDHSLPRYKSCTTTT